jgi:hypothetical protein
VKEFFEENPNCAKVLKSVFKTLASTNFVNPYGNGGKILDRKFSELGIKLSIGDSDITMRDAMEQQYYRAVSDWNNKIIYINPDLWDRADDGRVYLHERHLTATHELLHIHFRGDHIRIARALGLSIPSVSPDKRDDAASTAVDRFLNNDCKKPARNSGGAISGN